MPTFRTFTPQGDESSSSLHKLCFAFPSQHITGSGRVSVLAKEVGTGRDNSDLILTARHLVTDTQATSEEPISCSVESM